MLSRWSSLLVLPALLCLLTLDGVFSSLMKAGPRPHDAGMGALSGHGGPSASRISSVFSPGRWITHQGRALAREVKAHFSSRLEQQLLRATRPTELPIEERLLNKVLQTVTQFDSIRAYYKCEPSKVLVSKLWRKVNEDDWRTAGKALYIVHRLLQDSKGPEDAKVLGKEFRSVAHKSLEGGDHIHFKLQREDPVYVSWLEDYSAYLLCRSRDMTESFFQDPSAVATTPFRRKLATCLSSVNRLVKLGLKCDNRVLSGHPVVRSCLECVSKDLLQCCVALSRDDLDTEVEHGGDLIDAVLYHEALSYKNLLPQVVDLLKRYCEPDQLSRIERLSAVPEWVERRVQCAPKRAEDEPADSLGHQLYHQPVVPEAEGEEDDPGACPRVA